MPDGHELDPELAARIRSATSLPSPPAIAVRLIELSHEDDLRFEQVVEVLRPDPALTASILRLANSALYARRREAVSLDQAVVLLGTDAVLTTALSLTLVSGRSARSSALPALTRSWTRSVHAAAAAQILAKRCGGAAPGDAFLAALVQDIGILAFAGLAPEVYRDLPDEDVHSNCVERERMAFGSDHAAAGASLLELWRLPSAIVEAVRRSHAGDELASGENRMAGIVAVAGLLADGIAGSRTDIVAAADLAGRLLGVDHVELAAVLEALEIVLPGLAVILDADAPPPGVLAEMAAEAIVMREVRRQMEMTQMRDDLDGMTAAAEHLEAVSNTDTLTGVLNRRALDMALDREFDRANDHLPLSVLFVDLDDFKAVNDDHGHAAGDAVLRAAAGVLTSTLRSADIVGRYGGDEFVVVLPHTAPAEADIVARRLVEAMWRTSVTLGPGVLHHQSITIGVATTDDLVRLHSVEALLTAADDALLRAKRDGKGRHRAAARI